MHDSKGLVVEVEAGQRWESSPNSRPLNLLVLSNILEKYIMNKISWFKRERIPCIRPHTDEPNGILDCGPTRKYASF